MNITNFNEYIIQQITQYAQQYQDKRNSYKQFFDKWHCKKCGLCGLELDYFSICEICKKGMCIKHADGVFMYEEFQCEQCLDTE